MVFSSIPAYLDPANWQQHPNHQQAGGNPTHQLPLSSLPPPPPLLSQSDVGPEGIGTIRPGSMSERARLANMPMPDPALKCPRCESTNTKFCYFNNYNLTQPRHFCKTCRRYWTRGGALRSVPVGGGCRRNNKRTKSTSSNNSPASATTSTDRQTNSQNSTASTVSSTSPTTGPGNILGLMTSSSQIHQPLRFLSPLGQLSLDHHHHYYGGITSDINLNNNINYNNGGGGISTAPAAVTSEIMNFQLGTNFLGNGIEPWRFQQQFPFLGGLDLSAAASSSLGLFGQFQGGIGNNNVDFVGETSSQVRPKFSSSSMLTSQLASVKMEEHNNNGTNNQEANLLSRQLMMGMNNQSNDQWSTGTGAGNNWTDLSSLSSSSTSNPL